MRKVSWRWVGRALFGALLLGALIFARSTAWFAAFGGTLSGERLARAQKSSHYANGHFQNPVPTNMMAGSFWDMFKRQFLGGESRAPARPLPIQERHGGDYAAPPASGLRATWTGHSTVLLEIDAHRLLFDPIWSERGSPSNLIGPRRMHPVPLALEELPPLDAVIITHDHYDHLDMWTIKRLVDKSARFVVPLGVGAHLDAWDVPASKIIELDWGESTRVGFATATATPARHYSGRGVSDTDGTLWASWVITGARHRVFVSGDSGYFDGFKRIGDEYGPFDLTLLKIGSYGANWPDIHMTPEEAITAHLELRGRVLIPLHWATFNLAYHPWSEPPERAVEAAAKERVLLVIPRPGELVEPSAPPPPSTWWREAR